jgi:hypothetical protein
MKPARRAATVLATALAAAAAAGCASAPPPGAPPAPPSAAPAAPAPAPAPATAPWEIPPELLASQRLYRVRYQGPEGEGGLRLTLWLATPERYRARAVDLLGRPLWSLAVDGDGGLWVDHRAEVFCRLRGRADLSDLAGLSLAPFPLAALPPLLLGRLPAPPAPGTEPAPGGGTIEYRDAEGRRWTAALAGGAAPTSWALWGESGGGGALLTWLAAADGEAVLSDRAAGMQLRWRQVVAEALAGPPGAGEPPAGYREATCTEAAAAGTVGY